MTFVKTRGEHESTEEARQDGRQLRSERTREAIVAATLALLEEREREITMDRVAERAGVSVRTLYRQFQDTDSLVFALREQIGAVAAKLASDWAPVGTLRGDVEALVDARGHMFVAVEPLARLAQWLPMRKASPRELDTARRRRLRAELRAVVRTHVRSPESDDLEALEAWISFDTWTQLREQQRLSKPRALRVLKRTASVLVAALASESPGRR